MERRALADLLTGFQVRLHPFAAQLYPRDTLYRVWQGMEAERAWPRVMWWQDVPHDQKGSLAAFAEYMQDKTILLVEDRRVESLCGMIWYDEIVQGLRGNISIWFKRVAWGEVAEEAGRIATRYGHECLKLPALWGVSPWRGACAYAQRCGYELVACFPAYVYLNGKPMPMYFTCHREG